MTSTGSEAMPRHSLRVAGVLFAIALVVAIFVATRSSSRHLPGAGFTFNGSSIEDFHCTPGVGKHPGVILLHGAGYRGFLNDAFEAMCADLARHGFYAEFIEYMDAGDNTDPSTNPMENFRNWTGTINAGIEALEKNPEVDAHRIALMGFSQGAYLAVGTAAMYPHQVAAVVDYYGGLIPTLRDKAATMPPTLILHGEADTIIPVSEAHDLDDALTTANRPHEMHLYPGVDHGFNFHSRGTRYDQNAADDAWQRALDFLTRSMKSFP